VGTGETKLLERKERKKFKQIAKSLRGT